MPGPAQLLAWTLAEPGRHGLQQAIRSSSGRLVTDDLASACWCSEYSPRLLSRQ